MSDGKKIADLLRCAADHIDRVGFCQKDYFEGMGFDPWKDVPMSEIVRRGQSEFMDAPCCAYGALAVCAPDTEIITDAARAAMSVSTSHISRLNVWNDVPGRTKKDVVNLFRKAADSLESSDD